MRRSRSLVIRFSSLGAPRTSKRRINGSWWKSSNGRHALNLIGVPNVYLQRERLRSQGLHLGGHGEDGARQFLR
jgi:hypothetical protein